MGTAVVLSAEEREERIQQMLDLLEQGVPLEAASAAAAVIDWIPRASSSDPDAVALRERIQRAQAQAVVHRVALVNKVAQGGYVTRRVERTYPDGTTEVEESRAAPDWRAAAWMLERRFPNEWARKERIDVTSGGETLAMAGVGSVVQSMRAYRERRALETGEAGTG